jgi:hypothetical protein
MVQLSRNSWQLTRPRIQVDYRVVCPCGAHGPSYDNEFFAMKRWGQQPIDEPQKGGKFDLGKPPIHLIAPEMIDALASRLAIGVKKYGPRNWEKGLMYSQCFAAAQRHLWAWWGGEDFDPDPAVPEISSHLGAAFINIGFLVTFNARHQTHLDDRPRKVGAEPVLVKEG